jgi:indolepyruvate ferredoxin oxidoreductase alpha subunit
MENFNDKELNHPVLKISQYPLPKKQIKKLVSECETIIVIEEGYPLVEEMLKGFLSLGITVKGRLDGTLPRDGELNPNLVAIALGLPDTKGNPVPEIVEARPPSMCIGCPHIDSFLGLNESLAELEKGRVFSDIGCYTLSALPPFESINTTVDMGASITMAKGAADAGMFPVVAVIGDSTFTHSGITGLLDAVNEKTSITVIILDNSTTAMTGGQPSAALNRLEDICKGVGVEPEHIRVIKPLRKYHEENIKIMKEELDYKGVSVIIPRRECIQTQNKRMREKFKNKVS